MEWDGESGQGSHSNGKERMSSSWGHFRVAAAGREGPHFVLGHAESPTFSTKGGEGLQEQLRKDIPILYHASCLWEALEQSWTGLRVPSHVLSLIPGRAQSRPLPAQGPPGRQGALSGGGRRARTPEPPHYISGRRGHTRPFCGRGAAGVELWRCLRGTRTGTGFSRRGQREAPRPSGAANQTADG